MKNEVKNVNDKFTKDLKDGWVTINRKENKEKRWLKLTQAYSLEGGCLVKTSTEFRNVNWDIIACSESTAFVHNGKVLWVETETGDIKYILSVPIVNTETKTIETLLDIKPKAELDTKVFEKAVDSFIGGKDETVKTVDNEVKKKG